MTYHRCRFLLGLLQGAAILGLSAFALGLNPMEYFVPAVLFPKYEILCWPHVKALFTILVFYSAVCLPFDFLGGWVLPKIFKQPVPGFFKFLAQLAWAAVAWGVLMLFLGIGVITFAQHFGNDTVWILFVGLLAGLGGLSLSESFPASLFRFCLNPFDGWPAKRDTATGSSGTLCSSAVAIGWVLLGLWAASNHPQASFASSAGLLTIGLAHTFWMGASMVVFFLLSCALGDRWGFLACGRVEKTGRLALFLSLACLSFFSRAHPAVIGKPELWVPRSGN